MCGVAVDSTRRRTRLARAPCTPWGASTAKRTDARPPTRGATSPRRPLRGPLRALRGQARPFAVDRAARRALRAAEAYPTHRADGERGGGRRSSPRGAPRGRALESPSAARRRHVANRLGGESARGVRGSPSYHIRSHPIIGGRMRLRNFLRVVRICMGKVIGCVTSDHIVSHQEPHPSEKVELCLVMHLELQVRRDLRSVARKNEAFVEIQRDLR